MGLLDFINNKVELRSRQKCEMILLDSPENVYICFLNEAGLKNIKEGKKSNYLVLQNSIIVIENGKVIKNLYGEVE